MDDCKAIEMRFVVAVLISSVIGAVAWFYIIKFVAYLVAIA